MNNRMMYLQVAGIIEGLGSHVKISILERGVFLKINQGDKFELPSLYSIGEEKQVIDVPTCLKIGIRPLGDFPYSKIIVNEEWAKTQSPSQLRDAIKNIEYVTYGGK